MENILDQLHKDHIHFSKILDLLAEELEALRSDGSPNYTLMLDMVDYIENYPDSIHHPREDIVFEVFMERSDRQHREINHLLNEHAEMKQRTDELRETIEGILEDTIFDKEIFEQHLEKYVQQQRQHMETEEAVIYPMLRAKLTTADFERIEGELPLRQDPVFGKVVEKEYEALYRRITGV